LPVVEVYLIPQETILLSHSHAGMDRKQEMGQEFGQAAHDCSVKVLLFCFRKEPDAPATCGFASYPGSGISFDLLIVHADPCGAPMRRPFDVKWLRSFMTFCFSHAWIVESFWPAAAAGLIEFCGA
jgi:hypothetical protein